MKPHHSLEVVSLAIPDVKLIRLKHFEDTRGWLCETWRQDTFAHAGITEAFVQDNQSFSHKKGTVRGLHFQNAPHAQSKLVQALTGALFDVAVDVRSGSPTYGQPVTVELSASRLEWLFIPAGFAHGFCTLTPDTRVLYKTSAVYEPASEGGILWNDPALGISWPVEHSDAVVSLKDQTLPPLALLPSFF